MYIYLRVRFTSPHPKDFPEDVLAVVGMYVYIYMWVITYMYYIYISIFVFVCIYMNIYIYLVPEDILAVVGIHSYNIYSQIHINFRDPSEYLCLSTSARTER
jgi:hypothetical protein